MILSALIFPALWRQHCSGKSHLRAQTSLLTSFTDTRLSREQLFFWNCSRKHREGKIMRTVWAFRWVTGMAMANGNTVAWVEQASQTTSSASLRLHHLVPCWRGWTLQATGLGVLMWTEAHFCLFPLLFSSTKLLTPPTESLLCDPGHQAYWLLSGSHICNTYKNRMFWWCSHYCSTEIPKGGHKTLQHYCKCWQTLMNRLRYLPLLG